MNGIIIGLIAAFGIAIISLIITSLFRVSNRVDDARKEIGDKIDDGRKEISSKVDNVSNKIDGLGGKIDGLGSKVGKLPIEFIKLLRLIRQEEGPGGPNPRERENELLDKLGTEQISYDECIELRSILREELEDARRRNDAFDRFVISGILVHIRIFWRKFPNQEEEMTSRAVSVIGGGIAGIQASIDLADMGFKVYLVEKSPLIGGRMAQLDKTFPTNDCAMCILAPKMIGTGGHPNIELLTYSEIEEVSGEVGNFRVKVKRKAPYIDWNKYTGCGECE